MTNPKKKTNNNKTEKQPTPEFKILAQPDVSKGVYSNLAFIHHTQNEFIIDFLLKFTGEGQLVSRVIFSPQHTKAFLNAIETNIQMYESKFGKIKKQDKTEKLIN